LISAPPGRSPVRQADHPARLAPSQLLATIERKKSNLCISVDVTTKANLLRIADAAGPYMCCIKVSRTPKTHQVSAEIVELTGPCVGAQTHIDIVSDFDMDLVEQLQKLAEKHDFLIWEDRKFADIG